MNLEQKIDEIEAQDEITLADTVELMNNADYKARFVAEYMQTKIRYNALHKMLIRLEAGTLNFKPTCEDTVLEEQASNMGYYLKSLEIRAEIEGIRLPKNV